MEDSKLIFNIKNEKHHATSCFSFLFRKRLYFSTYNACFKDLAESDVNKVKLFRHVLRMNEERSRSLYGMIILQLISQL